MMHAFFDIVIDLLIVGTGLLFVGLGLHAARDDKPRS